MIEHGSGAVLRPVEAGPLRELAGGVAVDEIFQSGTPVLTAVDAQSTYCYLLQQVEHRDQDTWGFYLLEAQAQGLAPERTIADAAPRLRAGHEEVFGESVPGDGDVFHIQHQCQGVAHRLMRQAMGATTRRQELQETMAVGKSPAELMMGERHPHWLELLGFTRFKQA